MESVYFFAFLIEYSKKKYKIFYRNVDSNDPKPENSYYKYTFTFKFTCKCKKSAKKNWKNEFLYYKVAFLVKSCFIWWKIAFFGEKICSPGRAKKKVAKKFSDSPPPPKVFPGYRPEIFLPRDLPSTFQKQPACFLCPTASLHVSSLFSFLFFFSQLFLRSFRFFFFETKKQNTWWLKMWILYDLASDFARHVRCRLNRNLKKVRADWTETWKKCEQNNNFLLYIIC